jgi:hypothetical protein
MFSGTVYDASNAPTNPHYVLDASSLASLAQQLPGAPVRIEHEARDIGRITDATLTGGSLSVKWVLDQTASGMSMERLIEKGEAPELSLKHALYSDGAVRPIEVSIVRKGARAGCAIDTEKYKHAGENTSIMASAAEETVSATPVEPASAVAEDPAPKRPRFDSPVEFLKTITPKVNDNEAMESIADYIASMMENQMTTQQELGALRQAKEILEEAQKSQVESSKNVVRDIVDTLSSLYQNFASGQNMDEAQKTKLSSVLTENSEVREAMRPLLVAASAIHQRTAIAAAAATNTTLTAAMSRIETLQKQMAAARGMSSAPVAPMWSPVTVPAVEVAASVTRAPEPPKFKIPDILLNAPSFGEAGVGRITRDSFSRKV